MKDNKKVMLSLVERLKRDHVEFSGMLERIYGHGLDSEETVRLLLDYKERLLGHLRSEDSELYPSIKSSYTSNFIFKITMMMVEKEIKSASESAAMFFEKYPQGGSGYDFLNDLTMFLNSFRNRMDREDNIIFDEYVDLLS